MAHTYMGNASHALVGVSEPDKYGNRASGIIHWHDNEFDAHKEAKSINDKGRRAGGQGLVRGPELD